MVNKKLSSINPSLTIMQIIYISLVILLLLIIIIFSIRLIINKYCH